MALELRFIILNNKLKDATLKSYINEKCGKYDPSIQYNIKVVMAKYHKWAVDIETQIRIAEGLGLNILIAEGYKVIVHCTIHDIITVDKFIKQTPGLESVRKERLANSLERLRVAEKIFMDYGAEEQALSICRLRVDVLRLQDKKAEALKVASEIAKRATSAAISGIAADAKKIIAGEWLIDSMMKGRTIFET